jgi:hypothetical protein
VIHLSDILRDKAKREALFKLRDSDAQSLIDGLNYVSDQCYVLPSNSHYSVLIASLSRTPRFGGKQNHGYSSTQ